MRIFVSYSRRDAGDFANQIQSHFATFEQYEVFTDVDSIKVGDIWTNTIEDNISKCDVFVVIVTHGALQSPHVENEILQAQRETKRIIPCFHRSVRDKDIKWGLDKIQGVKFAGEFELARDLYSKIANGMQRKLEEQPAPYVKPKEEYDTTIWENYRRAKNRYQRTKIKKKIIIAGSFAIIIFVLVAILLPAPTP